MERIEKKEERSFEALRSIVAENEFRGCYSVSVVVFRLRGFLVLDVNGDFVFDYQVGL